MTRGGPLPEIDDVQQHALHRLNGLPEMIQGHDAASLMHEHNIHLHDEDPWEAGDVDDDHMVHSSGAPHLHHSADAPLHSSQNYLSRAGLEHFIRHPYAGDDGPGPRDEKPSTWEHQGQHWINGGHHRILADRMTYRNGVTVSDRTNRSRLGFRRVASEALPNPYADLGHGGPGGDHWYHGTSAQFSGAPKSPRWDRERTENWSTDLGTHYTALHDVAKDIARRKGTLPDSRVAHTRLGITHPADYENEHDLTDHAIDFARKRGMTFGSHSDPNVDEIDEHGTEDASLAHKETWLGEHPQRHEISDGFLDHLRSQGHDGITYGNSHEGPESHPSAIAFHDTPVTVDRWEHLHHDHPDFGKEHHEHTAGKGKPRHHAPDVARRADEEDEGQPPELAQDSGGDSDEKAPLRALAEHPKVASDLRRLPRNLQVGYQQKVDDLRRGEAHSSTHALHGPLKGWSATGINFQTRLVHRNVGDELHVLSVGNHDEAYESGIRRNAQETGSRESRFVDPLPHHAKHYPTHPGDAVPSAGDTTRMRSARYTAPHERLFGRTYGLDTRLWDGDRLRIEVRNPTIAQFGTFCERHGYKGWAMWAKIVFFGSEASAWTSPDRHGNNDFDLSIGINYLSYRMYNHADLLTTDQGIAARFTEEMHAELNDPAHTFPGVEGIYDQTWFANVEGWSIEKIKPYAAWDVVTQEWIVKPPELPTWSTKDFPEGPGAAEEVRGIIEMAEGILKMPEPYRTQNGAALWEFVHSNRSDAFGPQGEGWWDMRNTVEKGLDQKGLMQGLFDCHRRAVEDPSSRDAPANWSNDPSSVR
jgi:hypothetical protein